MNSYSDEIPLFPEILPQKRTTPVNSSLQKMVFRVGNGAEALINQVSSLCL